MDLSSLDSTPLLTKFLKLLVDTILPPVTTKYVEINPKVACSTDVDIQPETRAMKSQAAAGWKEAEEPQNFVQAKKRIKLLEDTLHQMGKNLEKIEEKTAKVVRSEADEISIVGNIYTQLNAVSEKYHFTLYQNSSRLFPNTTTITYTEHATSRPDIMLIKNYAALVMLPVQEEPASPREPLVSIDVNELIAFSKEYKKGEKPTLEAN